MPFPGLEVTRQKNLFDSESHIGPIVAVSSLYYINITIANDTSRVIRSCGIHTLTALKVSFTLLVKILSTGVTLDDCHLRSSCF